MRRRQRDLAKSALGLGTKFPRSTVGGGRYNLLVIARELLADDARVTLTSLTSSSSQTRSLARRRRQTLAFFFALTRVGSGCLSTLKNQHKSSGDVAVSAFDSKLLRRPELLSPATHLTWPAKDLNRRRWFDTRRGRHVCGCMW